MKSISFFLFIICLSAVSCKRDTAPVPVPNDGKGNFSYANSGSRRLIIMDVSVGSGNGSMIFDTGGLGLLLDSHAAARCFNMKKLERLGKATESSVYFPAVSRDFVGMTYFYPLDIPFYGGILHYDWFMVFDGLQDEFGYDGIFSIPQNDAHTWNFDFENFLITVRDGDSLSESNEDSRCFVCDVERAGEKIYLTDFPVSFSGRQGNDSISLKQKLLFDTGCSSAIAFYFNGDELEKERRFLEDNALLFYKTHVGDNTSIIFSPGIVNDTLMVTFRQKEQRTGDFPNFIGLELLSKFNIAVDLDKGKAYFKRNGTGNWADYINKNSSFERKALSLIPDEHFSTAFVSSIGEESPAYKGGLRQYDVIERFDGGNFSTFNTKYTMMRQRGEEKTFTFDIDRFGKKMRVQAFFSDLDKN